MTVDNYFKNKKYIIFDIDGTLVEKESSEIPFFFINLERLLMKKVEKSIESYKNRTFSSVINENTNIRNRKHIHLKMELIMLDFCQKKEWKKIEKTEKLKLKLEKSGKKIYYVTGNLKKPTIEKLEKSKINFLEKNLYSTTVENESKKEIIEKIICSEKLEKSKSISIGDSSYDYKISKELEIDFIMV